MYLTIHTISTMYCLKCRLQISDPTIAHYGLHTECFKQKTLRPYDVRIFIRTLLFDALIGNHDRHGRNLAFITTASGSQLSPIYDNVSYLGLESGKMLTANFNPTGKISTRETYEPSMSDYVRELKRLGYREDISEFYHQIKLTRIVTIHQNLESR